MPPSIQRQRYSSQSLQCCEIAVRHYPDMSISEIVETFRVSKSLIAFWVQRLHLQHTSKTEQRLREKIKANFRKGRTPESNARGAATLKRLRRLETFRVKSGLPQKTRMKISVTPNRTRKAIHYLIAQYNYFRDVPVGGIYTMYFDAETRRTPNESLFSRRYGLKFQQV